MKSKFLLTIAFIFLSTFSLLSQLSVKIVNENFNSNMMRWEVESNDLSEKELASGKYTISCKKEATAITSTIEVPHLQFSDYRITASLSKLKGIDDNGFGLVWGAKDENNELEFVISGNGQFKVMKWEDGRKTDLINWTYSSSINKWAFSLNVLKIESKDKVLRYYINDSYIAATNDLQQMGNRVGFVLNETMQVEADYLLVENLAPSFTNSTAKPDNAEISSVRFSGNKTANELYYNETAYIQVDITNHSTSSVKDLAIIIEGNKDLTGLEINPLTMIEEVGANSTKTISIKISADENIPDDSYLFNIKLVSLENKAIDAETLSLKTVGLSSYYANKTDNETNTTNENPYYNPDDNKKKKTNNNSGDACTKGCSGAGLLALITALVIAIL